MAEKSKVISVIISEKAGWWMQLQMRLLILLWKKWPKCLSIKKNQTGP